MFVSALQGKRDVLGAMHEINTKCLESNARNDNTVVYDDPRLFISDYSALDPKYRLTNQHTGNHSGCHLDQFTIITHTLHIPLSFSRAWS